MPQTVAERGEFGLIRRIHDLLAKEGGDAQDICVGMGDDAASVNPPEGQELLITCDCMVEGRHYLSDQITAYDLGRRAMVSNISDIGAMGGVPLYALVSLCLKRTTAVSDVEALYRGFLAELNPLGAVIIGGNLTESAHHDLIDITLVGCVERGGSIRRSTAKPGDAVMVTGYPGEAFAGLQVLLENRSANDLQDHPLVKAYHTPCHRAREGRAVAKTGLATAMIDTSDGFLGDLGHICEQSGVGASVIEAELPVSDALKKSADEWNKDAWTLVLQDSDDYELVITCAPSDVAQVKAAIASVSDVVVSEVGYVTDAAYGMTLIRSDGTKQTMETTGWDHFAREEEDNVR